MSRFKSSELNGVLEFAAPENQGSLPEAPPSTLKKRVRRSDDVHRSLVERVHDRVLNKGAYVGDACRLEGATEGEYNSSRKKIGYPTITELKKKMALEAQKPKDDLIEMLSIAGEVQKRSLFEIQRDVAIQERDTAIQQRDEETRARDISCRDRDKAVERRNKAIEEQITTQQRCDQLQARYDRIYNLAKKMCGFLPDLIALDDLIKTEVSGDNQG